MATMTLDDLSAQFSRAFGNQLIAVVLYGSAARGEHGQSVRTSTCSWWCAR